ncbi:hypothetical protein J2T04_001143 [Chryseobacterium lathyri]|uniref:Uncharacterized protein n=1 Tax=Chryseobacterium lathyri TaxID=395933 RepID=A0ABT9SIK3_9FLAO|nr:hypothetical protein [Chryseobacterium lathyri]MDQ0065183.1 hypothetical protein [Chryseobacterium lathyri]
MSTVNNKTIGRTMVLFLIFKNYSIYRNSITFQYSEPF